MISETKFRVENTFRVWIFEIFRFQKHAPNMENWRVKKFQNSEYSCSWTWAWPNRGACWVQIGLLQWSYLVLPSLSERSHIVYHSFNTIWSFIVTTASTNGFAKIVKDGPRCPGTVAQITLLTLEPIIHAFRPAWIRHKMSFVESTAASCKLK